MTVPSACSAGQFPNGDDADPTINVVSHEHQEAITDPNGNAWYDMRGYENADKCAWTFGTPYTVANGSQANMALPTGALPSAQKNFLIQRNWVNSGAGYCAVAF